MKPSNKAKIPAYIDVGEGQLRCPECGAMLGKGEHPEGGIEIKCRRCKAIIRFKKIRKTGE